MPETKKHFHWQINFQYASHQKDKHSHWKNISGFKTLFTDGLELIECLSSFQFFSNLECSFLYKELERLRHMISFFSEMWN